MDASTPPVAEIELEGTRIIGDWAGADPFAPGFRDDPYPSLNALRQRDPVNFTPVGTWRICRFDDLNAVFRKAKTSMTASDGSAPNFDPLDKRGSFLEFMLNKDGAEHFRLRRLAMKSLGPKTSRRMEGAVEEAVDLAIGRALDEGGMEAIGALARFVPSSMICRIMGVPDADKDMFIEWTAARTNAFFGRFLPPEVQQRTRDAGHAMADYFDELVRERRKSPKEDLVSELILAEEDGEKLTDDEIVVQAIGLIIAGFETTIGLIGNGLRSLVEHPDQLAKLRADPSLIDNAVDECLRYDTPILFNWRVLEEPYEVGGQVLPKDAVLWMMLACGNRDPQRFENPDRFDITRGDGGHVSFGGGVHVCLGNTLAKMEARHALRAFATRTDGLRIEAEPPEWSHSFFRVMERYSLNFV